MDDLEYINQGLFTCFVPISKAGEQAWNQMAEETQGTGKVLSIHASSTIAQLRKAGYKVGKAKKAEPLSMESLDALLKELED